MNLPSGMILAVEKTAIIVGKEYAFRERRIIGSPFQRVQKRESLAGDDGWRLDILRLWLDMEGVCLDTRLAGLGSGSRRVFHGG
jgi:hypothetical protein